MTIGQRAAKLIKERSWAEGTSFEQQCNKIDCSDRYMWNWSSGKNNPSASVLAEMLRAGYDIEYILLGESK